MFLYFVGRSSALELSQGGALLTCRQEAVLLRNQECQIRDHGGPLSLSDSAADNGKGRKGARGESCCPDIRNNIILSKFPRNVHEFACRHSPSWRMAMVHFLLLLPYYYSLSIRHPTFLSCLYLALRTDRRCLLPPTTPQKTTWR